MSKKRKNYRKKKKNLKNGPLNKQSLNTIDSVDTIDKVIADIDDVDEIVKDSVEIDEVTTDKGETQLIYTSDVDEDKNIDEDVILKDEYKSGYTKSVSMDKSDEGNKNILYILLGVIFLIIIILIAITYFNSKRDISDLNTISPDEINNQINFPKGEPDDVIDGDAIDNTEVKTLEDAYRDELEKKEAQDIKNIDILNGAGVSGDVKSCDEIIGDDGRKSKCIDNANLALSYINEDRKYCEEVKDINLKNTCLDGFIYSDAIKVNDPKICDTIIDDVLRADCNLDMIFEIVESDSFDGDISACDSLSGDAREDCESTVNRRSDNDIFTNATNASDPKMCNDIQNANLKNTCLDDVNYSLIISSGDVNRCSALIDTGLKSSCESSLSKASDDEVYRDAIKKKDKSTCENIDDSSRATECVDQIIFGEAISSRDEVICDTLKTSSIKTECLDFFENLKNN